MKEKNDLRRVTAVVRFTNFGGNKKFSSEMQCPYCGERYISHPLPVLKNSVINCDICKCDFSISEIHEVLSGKEQGPIFTYYWVYVYDPDDGSGRIPVCYILKNFDSEVISLIKTREMDFHKDGFKIEIKGVGMTESQYFEYRREMRESADD